MKTFYTKTLLLLALTLVGAGTARAQFSIGLDGIKFDTDSTSVVKQDNNPVSASVIIWAYPKPDRRLVIGRRTLSTIPTFELGWNALSGVGYDAYANRTEPVGDFFDIHNWRSTQVTLNLFHLSAYDRHNRVGVSVGLGLRANNYRFERNLSLTREDGIVVPYRISDVTDRGVKKSKMNIAAIHIPVEVMFGNPGRFAFSVGGYVDMVMNSHTKIKYRGGRKHKEHNLPVNFIQAGVTTRFTFSWFSVYASYQPTQIFKSGRGPEAQQWTIGIGF